MKSNLSKVSAGFLALFIGLCILFISQQRADAYLIILDMDVSTPVPPGPPGPLPGPPGPATGIESGISVVSGSTVTVIAYIVSTTGGFSMDAIGLDVNFGLPGDTATATPVPGSNLAGFFSAAGSASAPPFSVDVSSISPVGPGVPLMTIGLPPATPFAGSFGGSGYYDGASPAPAGAGGQFSGFGFMPPPGIYADVMGFDFVVTGAPGSTVTLTPSGIFTPGAGFPPGAVLAPSILPTPGGDAVYDAVSGMTFAGSYLGGTITIIPEPSAITLAAIALLALARRHR